MKSNRKKIQKNLTKGIALVILFILTFSFLSSFEVNFAETIVENSDEENVETNEQLEGQEDVEGETVSDDDFLVSEDTEHAIKELQRDISAYIKELANFNSGKVFDYEAFKEELINKEKIYISNEVELRALSIYVAEGNETDGKTFVLKNSIGLTRSVEWCPIGSKTNPFKGTLDGAGYNISGILINVKQDAAGLIGYMDGATVKNLIVTDSNISIPPEIDNANWNDIKSKYFVNYNYLGGIAGYAVNSTITNCHNKTSIEGGNYVGGIVGVMRAGNISDCTNSGTIKGYRDVGGIAGIFKTEANITDENKYVLSRCKNTGKIIGIACGAGGISGAAYKTVKIEKCLNKGEVILNKDLLTVYVNGVETTCSPQDVGGIVGFAVGNNENDVTIIEACINDKNAKVEGYKEVGGIVGQLAGTGEGTSKANYCINYSDNINSTYINVKGNKLEGGIAGGIGAKNAGKGIVYGGFYQPKFTDQKKTIINTAFKYAGYNNTDKEENGPKSHIYKVNCETNEYYYAPKDTDKYPLTFSDGKIYHGNDVVTTEEYCDNIKDEEGLLTTFGYTCDNTNNTIIRKGSYLNEKITIDSEAPQIEKSKIKILVNGIESTIAKKGDILTILVPFDEKVTSRIQPELFLNESEKGTTYEGITSDGDNVYFKFNYIVDGKESQEEESQEEVKYEIFGITLKNYAYDTFGNTDKEKTLYINFSEVKGLYNIIIIGSNTTSIQKDNITKEPNYKITYQVSGAIYNDGNLYFNKNSNIKIKAIIDKEIVKRISEDIKVPKIEVDIGNEKISSDETEGNKVNTTYRDNYTVVEYTINSDKINALENESGNVYLNLNSIKLSAENIKLLNNEGITILEGKLDDKGVQFDNIFVDIKAPELYLSSNVNNRIESGRYTVGEDILITATTSEPIVINSNERPEINVSFSESGLGKYNYQGENATTGNAKYIETVANKVNDKIVSYTYKYRYTIQPGDEGSLQLNFAEGSDKIKDIAGNETEIKDQENINVDKEKSDYIYADTTAPTVTIMADESNPTNADKIIYKFIFSEEIEGFGEEDIIVNNANIVEGSFVEIDGGYQLEVKPTITSGNEGIVQLAIEEGVVKDVVGINNVRQESSITVDKVRPTLTSYEIGEESGKITITAIFSEALSEIKEIKPIIKVGGKENGNGTWQESEHIEDNKVKFVYNKDGADGGEVEVTLTGIVEDIAGNSSEKLNILLDNDILLKQTVIRNGEDIYSFKKNNEPINDFTAPIYFVKGDKITVIKTNPNSIAGEEYNYIVASEDFGDLTHIKSMQTNNSEISFSDKENSEWVKISEANIYFDTVAPKVITEIIANNPKNEAYTTGEEFIIKATTSEVIQENAVVPEIRIKFEGNQGKFNEGKVQYKETIHNENGTITWVYRYVVSIGDEGRAELSYINGEIIDLAGNTTKLTELNSKKELFVLNGISVDATAPIVKIAAKEVKNNITNANKITYTFTWSEEVNGFDAEDITVNNGTKGQLNGPTKKEDGTYSYTMDITTNIEKGNVGEVQVIVEQDACQDKVGQSNVRTESVIRVDKQAPILVSLEAYANSDLTVEESVDTVKQYYKSGDSVTVVATFSENIKGSTVPVLALQFNESGNAKGTVTPGIISGNKITYTYTLTGEDNGTLSVKGFSGTVKDAAGNETVVTKRNLNGDTIIADTKAPTLIGITAIAPNFEYDGLLQAEETKRYGVQSKTRTENTITIIAEYSENVYNLSSNTINKITDNTDPVLKLKFGTGTTRTAKYDKTEGSKIYYKYDITSGDNGDNGDLSIVSLSGSVSDIAGNTCTTGTSLPTLDKYEESIAEENEVNNITADTKNPTFTITATAVNNDDNKNVIIGNGSYYRKGSIITVTAKTNEYVYKNNNKELTKFAENGSNAPQLNVSFATSGNGVGTCTSVEYTNNQTIFTYTYEVKENDNGTLSLNIAASQGYDIALNGNNVKTQSISNIIADTVNPVTNWQSWVESEQYGIVDKQNGTWTVTFSEILYDYDSTNHKVGNQLTSSNKTSAPILLVSSDNQTALETTVSNIETTNNKTVITYTYSPYTKNLGAFGMKFANVSDKAGNLFNYKDQKAPTLSSIKVTEPISGTYKAGQQITIVATFSEKVTGTAPTLQLQFSESGDAKGIVSEGIILDNTITYTYTITDGDNGKLSLKSFTGTGLKDLSDNLWVTPESVTLTGNTIIADTIAPTLAITSDVERTNKDVVTYTFTWNETVTEFTAEDIEVINGYKGEFTVIPNKDGKEYTLEVDTIGEGRQIVKVNANVCTDVAGNSNVQRATYNQVVIDYTKPEVRAKVNGGKYVIDVDENKSTLKETLVVNEEVSKFEYIWSKETTIPEIGFKTINPDEIQINSDIKLETQVEEAGTYYLYMKVTDLAGNDFVGRTNGFIVSDSKITLTPNKTEATNQDVTVTVSYGVGLTENRKAGISGKTQSADSTKVIISENGTVYAEATDLVGNKVYKTQEITCIDKDAPKATITYTNNEDGTVTAKVEFDEEGVTITNNDAKDTYVFTENGEFTFEFKDAAGNTGTAVAEVTTIVPEDNEAPTIAFDYTLSNITVGEPIGATILTNEDAIISYSWDNKQWTTSEDYITSVNATYTTTEVGTYTLYAKAEDRSENESEVQTLQFTVVNKVEDIKEPEIIFEDLPTIQVDGIKYVKVPEDMTAEILTSKMNKEALCGKTPEYIKLTQDGDLRTTSEITIEGKTKYIIVVRGDINCDGKVTFTDIIKTNGVRISRTEDSLLKAQLLAVDINNTGKIEFRDIISINAIRINSAS